MRFEVKFTSKLNILLKSVFKFDVGRDQVSIIHPKQIVTPSFISGNQNSPQTKTPPMLVWTKPMTTAILKKVLFLHS